MPPWQLPTKLTCRTSARSLFQKSFLHKEDIIVQQYAPVVEETHIGNTIVNGERSYANSNGICLLLHC